MPLIEVIEDSIEDGRNKVKEETSQMADLKPRKLLIEDVTELKNTGMGKII